MYRETAAEHDDRAETRSIRKVHKAGETSSAMSALPAAFCQLSGGKRKASSYVEQVTGAVKRAISLIKKDNASFSGISMRRGGISQAVHARVPEPILFLQSRYQLATCRTWEYGAEQWTKRVYE